MSSIGELEREEKSGGGGEGGKGGGKDKREGSQVMLRRKEQKGSYTCYIPLKICLSTLNEK